MSAKKQSIEPAVIWGMSALAERLGRSVRTVYRMREEGIVPEPDIKPRPGRAGGWKAERVPEIVENLVRVSRAA